MSDTHEYPPCTGQCCQGLAVARERLDVAQVKMYQNRTEIQALNGQLATARTALAAVEAQLGEARQVLELAVSAADAMPYAQHYGHFDREGGAGRTCPACIDERKQRDVVRERTTMARAFLSRLAASPASPPVLPTCETCGGAGELSKVPGCGGQPFTCPVCNGASPP